MAFIEVNNLVKDYKVSKKSKGLSGMVKNILHPDSEIIHAVNQISFSIEKGEMVGFIGPNGAGKSTTVKMLSGILHPTGGSINVMGITPYKERKEYVKKIGVVFGQKTQLWWDLPVGDTFDLLKHIYKIPDSVFRHNMEMFNELLGLDEFKNQSVRQLSLGQRMRADIAAALIHNPEIVFFDEPTIGLDVVAKEKIRQFINCINKDRGTTMIFTTHDMQDIEKTCERMIIIDKGIKIYDGGIDEIKIKHGRERSLVVEFAEACNISIPGVQVVNEGNNKKRFTFDRELINMKNLIVEITSKYSVTDLTINEPEIESIIREIYEGGIYINETVS